MKEAYTFRVIARIRTDYKEKFGIPRQSGRIPGTYGRIVFEKPYRNPDAIRGMEAFSHLWLLFIFSESVTEAFVPTVRPPRLGGNRKMGVFATRSPFRPNPVGLSSVRLVRVEENTADGPILWVEGADLLDGTPLVDIKPYLPFTDSHPDASSGFAAEGLSHRLTVQFSPDVSQNLTEDMQKILTDVLAEDPRPSYQEDPTRVYGLRFADYHLHFTVSGDNVTVIDLSRE